MVNGQEGKEGKKGVSHTLVPIERYVPFLKYPQLCHTSLGCVLRGRIPEVDVFRTFQSD